MRPAVIRIALGVFLASGLAMTELFSQEDVMTLPTLLIKGEIVSLDSGEESALLKVKDRYGFETPIYLTDETAVKQGDADIAISSLPTGSEVEVEYSFDVNTAKRHAVSVSAVVPEEPEMTEEDPASDETSPNESAADSMDSQSQLPDAKMTAEANLPSGE